MSLNIEQQMQENSFIMGSKGGIWVQALGSYSKQKATAKHMGYRNKARGSLIGIDYKLLPHLFVGMSAGYGLSDVKWDENVTKGDIKHYISSVYSTWSKKDFYINGSLSFVQNRIKSRRRITFATIDRTADGSHNGYTLAPSLEIGHLFILKNGLEIAPFIREDYVYDREETNEEKNAGALNLRMKKKASTQLRSEPGINFYQHFKREDDLITAKFKISYVNKKPLNNPRITANLVGQPGSFIASGSNKTQHQVSPGIGIDYKTESGLFISTAYDAQLGSKYKAHEISLKVGYRF